MTSDDLLYYYKTVIRPVTEYACAVWHSSITAEQRDQLEAIQRRAVRIIFGKELDFDILAIILSLHDIPLLADRRDRQMRQLFTGMHDSSHCLRRTLRLLCRHPGLTFQIYGYRLRLTDVEESALNKKQGNVCKIVSLSC